MSILGGYTVCPTSCAGTVVVGMADHIAVAVTVTMSRLNAASPATSAGAVVVGMADHSALSITVAMSWGNTVHCAVITIIIL